MEPLKSRRYSNKSWIRRIRIITCGNFHTICLQIYFISVGDTPSDLIWGFTEWVRIKFLKCTFS